MESPPGERTAQPQVWIRIFLFCVPSVSKSCFCVPLPKDCQLLKKIFYSPLDSRSLAQCFKNCSQIEDRSVHGWFSGTFQFLWLFFFLLCSKLEPSQNLIIYDDKSSVSYTYSLIHSTNTECLLCLRHGARHRVFNGATKHTCSLSI